MEFTFVEIVSTEKMATLQERLRKLILIITY